ncbi:Exocyst complex component 5 [Hypsibius exemplaris]|uniref:Exocyst complex component 5 n=1 Tax=Hypsibius exemplaris TaxID=2072580 RepID=A0A1W0WQV7_HYPEX|nr:Exocyst complex component 5 [Hypsibius exemplaris]
MAMLTSALLDIDDLRQEVQETDFNADEWLESYIQRNMGLLPGGGSSTNGGQLMNLTDSQRGNSLPTSPTEATTAKKNSLFDPERLLQSFNDLFDNLVYMNGQYTKRYRDAEVEVERKEAQATERLMKRADRVDGSIGQVEKLEREINDLARRIYKLNENIYSVSEPQERLKDARKLLTHFMELNQDALGEFTFPELTKPRKNFEDFRQASSTVLRLHRIAKDMGTAEDRIYSKARDRIFDLYNQLQRDLIELFTNAHKERPVDITTMQKTAELLQNFPAGQQQCVAVFIQRTADSVNIQSADVFRVIVQLATDTYKIIREIFPSPEGVMEKFVTYVITEKLQGLIKTKLEVKNTEGQEGYLRDLYELHKKTKTLEQSVEVFKQVRMDKILRMLFDPYLSRYVETECNFLRIRCTGMMQQYYDGLLAEWGLPKQQTAVQVLPEKRDFFGVSIMTAKTLPVVMGEFLKEHPTVTADIKIINESLALNLLHELRQSAARAHALAPEDQLGACLLQLGQTIINTVLLIHMDYGLEIGIIALPPLEPKAEPNTTFLHLIQLSTVLHNLTVRQLDESLKSLPRSPAHQQKLRDQLREARERLERKSSAGLEHCLNSAMSWIHTLLMAQKRTEYAEPRHSYAATNTARKVAQYFMKLVRLVEASVDGLNRQSVFMEMGFRFHREIFDRLQELPYTSDGVMILICDVNEYRECVRMMKVDLVIKLFDQLLSLCNLLVAQPVNLPLMCDSLYGVIEQKEPIAAFIRLRSDFKTSSEYVRSYL